MIAGGFIQKHEIAEAVTHDFLDMLWALFLCVPKIMNEGGMQWIPVDPAEQEQLFNTYKKIAIQVVPEAMEGAGLVDEGVMYLDQIYQKATGHDLAWWKSALGMS